MRNPILPDLRKLKKQIENLKKEREKKLTLSTSVKERNKLMIEIQELDMALKVPSKLKSFAKTFFRGSNIVRKTLWRGIKEASRNLDRNAPEFRELSKGMVKRPTPISPMMDIYAPSQQRAPIRKMKTRKIKKRKKKSTRKPMKRMKTRTMQMKPQQSSTMTWEMP